MYLPVSHPYRVELCVSRDTCGMFKRVETETNCRRNKFKRCKNHRLLFLSFIIVILIRDAVTTNRVKSNLSQNLKHILCRLLSPQSSLCYITIWRLSVTFFFAFKTLRKKTAILIVLKSIYELIFGTSAIRTIVINDFWTRYLLVHGRFMYVFMEFNWPLEIASIFCYHVQPI